MKILITGGGCREYIDSVRIVTNSSTGRTSAELADFFAEKGCEVTLITAETAIKPKNEEIKIVEFQTGQELSQAIQSELCVRFSDAVIHAAAVSDYIPSEIITNGKNYKAGKSLSKLHSENDLTVIFKPAPKIADSLRYWAAEGGNSGTKIVCFKLTNRADFFERKRSVIKLFSHSGADFIVANDLSEISDEKHIFKIVDSEGKIISEGSNNIEMAQSLLMLFEDGSKK